MPAEPETRYARQERELRQSPATWIPALLMALVETAEGKEVFKEDGLLKFVSATLERCKERNRR